MLLTNNQMNVDECRCKIGTIRVGILDRDDLCSVTEENVYPTEGHKKLVRFLYINYMNN